MSAISYISNRNTPVMSQYVPYMYHICTRYAEFLKAATMRPYGRAKFFRDCARFCFLNKKMHNLPLFYLFGSLFKKICCFLALFVCAKLLNRNIGRAKQIVFRKSASCTAFHMHCTALLLITSLH